MSIHLYFLVKSQKSVEEKIKKKEIIKFDQTNLSQMKRSSSLPD